VDTSVTGSFTFALCFVLSDIHNLFFLVKFTGQHRHCIVVCVPYLYKTKQQQRIAM